MGRSAPPTSGRPQVSPFAFHRACGSREVQKLAWVDLNTGEVFDDDYLGDFYCARCDRGIHYSELGWTDEQTAAMPRHAGHGRRPTTDGGRTD